MALKGNWVAKSYANDAAATTGYGGGTPTSGSIYYNTTDSVLKLWTGSAWATCGVSPPSKLEIEYDDIDGDGIPDEYDLTDDREAFDFGGQYQLVGALGLFLVVTNMLMSD